MHLNGLKLNVLNRADECARILTPHKCGLGNDTPLTAADRGVLVAFLEVLEAQIAEQNKEIQKLRTAVLGTGGTVLDPER